MAKKKTLTLILTAAILVAAIASAFCVNTAAFAADDFVTVTEGFTYNADDATEITGLETPVTGSFHLVIPKGVKKIGEHAFEDCENLTGVTFCDGLESIGAYAFTGTSITLLTVPNSVNTIGMQAFNGCADITEIIFEEGRTETLTVGVSAFENCAGLRVLRLPDNTAVGHSAFIGCTGLLWVYAGTDCVFTSNAGEVAVTFFPANSSLKIIFPSREAYDKMLNQTDETFKNAHGAASTYVIKIKLFVDGVALPALERLHGYAFNYVMDEDGNWNNDSAFTALPVQAAHYAETVWYGDSNFGTRTTVDGVSALLLADDTAEIRLYAHETIALPEFPEEPASWIESKDVSYDITDTAQVLQALGCTNEFTPAQLAAMDCKVTVADESGNPKDLPEAINGVGVYSVTLTLKDGFGSWSQTVTATVTVNADTAGFNTVMIVLIIIGVLAVAITVSTAIIRKKVQARNKKKQLSQKEIIEKFKAAGGESDLL